MAQDDPTQTVIPLAEERLQTGKRRVLTGRVRVHVDTVTEETPVTADLLTEQVEVTRVPVGREVSERPAERTEGDVTIIPVVEEVLTVERRLILREEIHLRRIIATDAVETSVPLRRQRAVIERDDSSVPTQSDTTFSEDDQ